MYDDLVKRLWECASGECFNCSQYTETTNASVCSKELMKQAADAIENTSKAYQMMAYAFEAEVTKQRWIPVSERLPQGGDKSGQICANVLLYFDDGNVYPGWMNGCSGKVYYLDDYNDYVLRAPISRVKMWQPLPEPPKEEDHV